MKYAIILLFYAACNHSLPVQISQKTSTYVLRDMYYKNILESRKDTLYILLDNSIESHIDLPNNLKVDDKTIEIVEKWEGLPRVQLYGMFDNAQDSTKFSIRFLAMNFPGKKYKGQIEFQRRESDIVYNDIFFYAWHD